MVVEFKILFFGYASRGKLCYSTILLRQNTLLGIVYGHVAGGFSVDCTGGVEWRHRDKMPLA